MDMLTRLKNLDEPIKFAMIGAGSAGKGLLYQSSITPGMKCVAVADKNVAKAIAAAEAFNLPHRTVETMGQLHDAIDQGILAVCQDGDMPARCESANVLLDASSAMIEAVSFALGALETGKDLVMMNAEADLIFGPYLMHLAQEKGLVYTSCDGDQPGVIRRMVDDVRLWGFELVMAGNVKGFLDRYSNPAKIAPEADKRFLDHKMCASYTDGTKLCVEMALVANALGLETLIPGMHGPKARRLLDILGLFDFEAIHRGGRAVVDYVIGCEPCGGVFAVGYSDSEYQKSMLGWFPSKLGPGPFYVFHRPYHLIHIEAMRCVAEAFLDRDPLLQPVHGFKTNVCAYAKRDLRQGETLDGLGGYACYGMIENWSHDRAAPGLPICLAEDVAVRRDIPRDQRILMSDIHYGPARLDFATYLKAVEQSRRLSG